MNCLTPPRSRLDLDAYTNGAFSQIFAAKKNGVLRDLTNYAVKAEVDLVTSKLPFVVAWLPPNPDWHFTLSLPVTTMAAIAPGEYKWDWLLIDPTNVPKRKPGGLFRVHPGVTTL